MWASSVIFNAKLTTTRWEKIPKSGVNVIITICCDFCLFSLKNCVFLKNQCYDHNFFKN
jgi:hypothetical protein